MQLSHVHHDGSARMVDISDKEATARKAVARSRVRVGRETLELITTDQLDKGDVLATARIAGIMAAKKTPDLIPLCHPLQLADIDISFNVLSSIPAVDIYSTVKTTDRTGVEMEALAGASLAALTVYDMCKSVEKGIVVENTRLLKKTGGKSGTYLDSELTGEIAGVCRSEEKGTPKSEIPGGELREQWGLEGDAHAGQKLRQVSLLAAEDIAEMEARGLDLDPGAFGENLITRGLNLPEIPVGTLLRIGEEVRLEVTQIGKECHDRCHIYHTVGDCIMPRRGIFARVLEGGPVRPGDGIEVVPDA